MKEYTIGEITKVVEESSTSFEKTNTDLKRKYLIWSICAFNEIVARLTTSKGSFRNRISFLCFRYKFRGNFTNNF